ncbi:MAG: F0F1 ATP synthase subunit B [Hyphomicrobiaceae bacterium]|nr:F0F1 ATP synthase subunit B [Hyphomicrobiaceae bacterium]MCC0010863.1 F0F1 ATP synthase subunit B [Hyphomicrobiaceae bacterium]
MAEQNTAQKTNAQPHNTEVGVIDAPPHPKAFPPLDPNHFAPQIIWLAITFALLYALMSRVALPRIGEVIEERRDRIQRDIDAAEALKGETERAIRDYEQSLSDARNKASGIAKETHEKLAAETDAKRKESDAAVNATIAAAEDRIAEMKKKALSNVSEIATDTTSAIVAKLIGETVSASEVKKHL